MSVQTTSDNMKELMDSKLRELKTDLNNIESIIDVMFDKNTWGFDEWSIEYRNEVYNIEDRILDLKRAIIIYLSKK